MLQTIFDLSLLLQTTIDNNILVGILVNINLFMSRQKMLQLCFYTKSKWKIVKRGNLIKNFSRQNINISNSKFPGKVRTENCILQIG